VMADSAPATNEELRSKLMDVQIELQQERGKVRGRKRKRRNQRGSKTENADCTCQIVVHTKFNREEKGPILENHLDSITNYVKFRHLV